MVRHSGFRTAQLHLDLSIGWKTFHEQSFPALHAKKRYDFDFAGTREGRNYQFALVGHFFEARGVSGRAFRPGFSPA